MLNVKELALEIYISGQVDTLNKTFKLSYTRAGRLVQIFTIRFPTKYFLTSTRL